MYKYLSLLYNKTANKIIKLISNIKIIYIRKYTSCIFLSLLICLKLSATETSTVTNNLTQELLLAEFALSNNQPLKALEIYQRIARETNDPKIAARATELALETKQDQQALQTVKIWADADKKNTKESLEALDLTKAQLLASILIMQYENTDNAYNYLTKLLKSDNAKTPVYIDLLLEHPFNQQKLQEVYSLLKKIKTQEKLNKNANASLALALVNEKLGDGAKSLEYINQAIKINPKLQSAHIHKIKMLNIHKSADEALAYLEETITKFPENHDLRKLYADILYDLEKWSKAEAQYQSLEKYDIYKEDAILQLAYISITNNDFVTAKKHLKRLTQSNSYSDIANYNLGLIEQQLGQNKKALEYFANIKDGEYFIRSQIRAATVLTELNQFTEAKNILESCLANTSANNLGYIKELILSEAELLYQQGLYQNALAILENIKYKYPEDPDINYSMAIIAKKLNNTDLFKKHIEAVIAKNPDNANALSALGWHYYKTQDHKQAQSLLEKAYNSDSFNSSRIGARYAAVLWKLGDKNQANKIWQKVLELDPYNDALRDMIEDTKKNTD